MATIATHYYPVTDIYFKEKKEVSLRVNEGVINDPGIVPIGFHVFNWSPESYMTVQTVNNQIITFPPTSIVEGAVYYIRITKIINAGPNEKETQVMAICG